MVSINTVIIQCIMIMIKTVDLVPIQLLVYLRKSQVSCIASQGPQKLKYVQIIL